MRQWLKERPWIWIVLFFLVVFLASAALVVIALTNQPTRIPTS